jgi:hypothetical protein
MTKADSAITFDSNVAEIKIAVAYRFNSSRGNVSAGLDADVSLTFAFAEPRTAQESITLLKQIEMLISLLCFSYLKAQRMEVRLAPKEGEKERALPVSQARLIEGGETEIEWKTLPLKLDGQTFGDVVSQFVQIYNDIRNTLDWYRIVQAEDRYVEDKFLYSIRMIEGLYLALNMRHKTDEGAMALVARVIERCSDDRELVDFMNKRVAGMFQRPWDLAQIIRDLKERYSEMCSVQILDPVLLTRLRGKETHGGSGRHTAGEQAFMVYSYDILVTLYVLLILEHCGLPREFLLSGLNNTRARYFSGHVLDQMRRAVNDGHAT